MRWRFNKGIIGGYNTQSKGLRGLNAPFISTSSASTTGVLRRNNVDFNFSSFYCFPSAVGTHTYVLTCRDGSVPLRVELYGAAGGNGSYSTGSGDSGAGGFIKGDVTIEPGETFYIYIGRGGTGTTGYAGNGIGGWPGGGHGTRGDASGAGGGGFSALTTKPFPALLTQGEVLLLAGGGGASTGYSTMAGAGGGANGQNSTAGMTAGTTYSNGSNGGWNFRGGNGTGFIATGTDDGGGGGGGYYGGGGGTSDAKAGAGGGGRYNSSRVTNLTRATGSYTNIPSGGFLSSNGYLNPYGYYVKGKVDNSSAQNGYPGIGRVTLL